MAESVITPWVIELLNPGMPVPLRIRLEGPQVIGRMVEGDARQPDIDMGSFGGDKEGVSRQHASFTGELDRLLITDLESHNGTFVNGAKLIPNQPHRLVHGDVLLLGKMRLEVSIILSPNFGGEVFRQPSLQLHDQIEPGRGQLVLIVQADAEIAAVLGQILERAGYTTRVSQEVVGAIRAYKQLRPAAILLDPVLPDMNGLEFCRYVRRDTTKNTTPVAVLLVSEKAGPVPEALQAGADIVLPKPVSARELRHVVSSLINTQESGQAAMYTKHLVGTAPLVAVPPESRRNAAVLFVAGHSDSPITLTITQPVSFGRAASTASLKTHVDLTRFDAANFGVSRLHMLLRHHETGFYIEDQDSVNGTFLNGDPVTPRTPIPVKNGDEIRLGQLRTYIYFLEDPHKTQLEPAE